MKSYIQKTLVKLLSKTTYVKKLKSRLATKTALVSKRNEQIKYKELRIHVMRLSISNLRDANHKLKECPKERCSVCVRN